MVVEQSIVHLVFNIGLFFQLFAPVHRLPNYFIIREINKSCACVRALFSLTIFFLFSFLNRINSKILRNFRLFIRREPIVSERLPKAIIVPVELNLQNHSKRIYHTYLDSYLKCTTGTFSTLIHSVNWKISAVHSSDSFERRWWCHLGRNWNACASTWHVSWNEWMRSRQSRVTMLGSLRKYLENYVNCVIEFHLMFISGRIEWNMDHLISWNFLPVWNNESQNSFPKKNSSVLSQRKYM